MGRGECEVLWGPWPGKALWYLLSKRKSKEMLIVMPEYIGWEKGDYQKAREGESSFRMRGAKSGLCTWLRALLVLPRFQIAPGPCRVLGRGRGQVRRRRRVGVVPL